MIRDRISIIQGDITELRVDAIVNAANSALMGGGGVDGAIHRAGGSDILKECKEIIQKIGYCKTGQAVITTGGKLPARYVIHTVGPVWEGGKSGETEQLIGCYESVLALARDKGLKTVAFPNISTGVFGYPKDEAAAVAVHTTIDFFHAYQLPEKVIFCCFDKMNYHWTDYYLQSFLNHEN